MQSPISISVFLLILSQLHSDFHIHGLKTTRNIQYSAQDSLIVKDNGFWSKYAKRAKRNLPNANVAWTPPIAVWSQLKFPVIPEIGPRNPKPVPEPFDAKKLNATISKDGFLVGQKFCQCGRRPWRSTREDPLENDIPWTATLVLTKYASPLVFCGGALINDLFVATAAHCVDNLKPEHISILLNEEELLPSSTTIYQQTHKFDVTKIIIHEKYNRKTIAHDIALLQLSEPIDFFEVPVSPACLPIRNDDYHSKYNGTVTRWVSVLDSRGNDTANTLQKASLPLISVAQCNLQFLGLISENHICTKSCQGDSGGPLIIERNERKHLVGIGSWGLDCTQNRPSVYTRVAKYAAWILQNSKTAEWCVE